MEAHLYSVSTFHLYSIEVIFPPFKLKVLA